MHGAEQVELWRVDYTARGIEDDILITPDGPDRIRVEFRESQRGIAPGQSAVVDLGERVLGGGRIVETLR